MKSIASPQTMSRFAIIKCQPIEDVQNISNAPIDFLMNCSPSASASIKKRIGEYDRRRSSKLSQADDPRA